MALLVTINTTAVVQEKREFNRAFHHARYINYLAHDRGLNFETSKLESHSRSIDNPPMNAYAPRRAERFLLPRNGDTTLSNFFSGPICGSAASQFGLSDGRPFIAKTPRKSGLKISRNVSVRLAEFCERCASASISVA